MSVDGTGSHTGLGTVLGWKHNGERTGDTPGSRWESDWSNDQCHVDFENGGGWNLPMSLCTIVA